MKKFIYLCLLFFISGCATQNPLTDFRFQTQVAPPYILASWYNITEIGQPIRIYIEGDGNAFNARGEPTTNPTPQSSFLREIAAQDPNMNVAYLGRPCQYIQTENCSQTDWTSGRFSQQVIQSMNNAVKSLMKKAQTDKAVLIGYSGGAQIAGLIAIQNPYISKVITIAGVLDTDAWIKHHGDTPLTNSINLKKYENQFKNIPQIHYVGGKDTIVPIQLTQQFISDKNKIIIVPKATHNKGFDSIYEHLYQEN